MNNLLDLIDESKSISIISHINPDGDSLGSMLGLGLALKKIHPKVTIFVNDIIPGKYMFLPGLNHLIKYDLNKWQNYELTFVLDCGDEKRLDQSKALLKNSKRIVNIDHHISNDFFGDYNIIDTKASSTCEIIYYLLKERLNIEIDTDIATNLYVGIMTDTGSFKYDNTSPKTHITAANLLEAGIDTAEISLNLYQSNSIESMKFLGYILSNLELHSNDKVAIVYITKDLIEQFGIDPEETDSMINYARDLKGVEIAITLRELEVNLVKASFRAKGDFDVNKLANAFGGGGHKKASGAVLEGAIDDVKEHILNEIEKTKVSW
ncbi:DHH family phosphoesterase [Alkaliphilus pronyensis]|nr:bifunctional oligoribonuclease/PAP phosphatase NrnA [Alkaliphilus pronyensis]